jgi:serralysin
MPATASYSLTGDQYINGILTGTKWAVGNLRFSFPTNPAYYGTSYGKGEPNHHFEAFNSTQQMATHSILGMYASVVNLSFTEVAEGSKQHGDLRLCPCPE